MKTQVLCAMRDSRAVVHRLRLIEDEYDCIFRIVQTGEAAMAAAQKCRPDILVVDAVLPLIDGLGVVDKMKEMFGQRMPRVIGGCMMPFAQEGFMRRGVMTLVRVPWEENQLAAALEEMIVKAREEIDWRSLASVCRRAGQMLEGMGMKPTLRGYEYLTQAAALVWRDESRMYAVGEKLYKPIAEHGRTTGATVERLIRHAVESTMDSVGVSTDADRDADLPVVFLRITDSGTEALVDNRYHLLAGNAAFLGRSGVRIPRESTDRAARRAGNVSLMYVAIDGVLKLSYEIEYSTAPDFEQMAGILADADTVTAIQTYDPNLNEAFLRSSRGEGAPYVRVIKPGRYEQDSVQTVVDSGVLALGKTTDIARPVCAASAIVRLRQIGFRALCAGSAAGAVIGVLMGFHLTDFAAGVPILLPTVFRLCLDLATALAVRTVLPSGKRE